MLFHILMLLAASYTGTCLTNYTVNMRILPFDYLAVIDLGNIAVGDQFTFNITFYPDTGVAPTSFEMMNVIASGWAGGGGTGFNTDLHEIAKQIMDSHDPNYKL